MSRTPTLPAGTSAAQWWRQDAANSVDKHGVKAHTPDPTQYHTPDSRSESLMRLGERAVMIPRGRADGSSRGFNANVASDVIHVDPDAPGGGIAISTRMLSNEMLKAAVDAVGPVGTPDDEHRMFAAFDLVAQAQEQAGFVAPAAAPAVDNFMRQPTVNTLVPAGTYVTPHVGRNGVQPQPEREVYPVAAQQPPMQPVPILPPGPIVATPAAPSVPQGLDVTQLFQLFQMFQANQQQPVPAAPPPQQPDLANMVRRAQPRMTPPPPVEPRRAERAEEEVGDTMDEAEDADYTQRAPPPQPRQPQPRRQQPRARVAAQAPPPTDVSFAGLEIPFITGPTATRPAHTVIFDYGTTLGQFAIKYHDVIMGDGCIALVNDLRYDEGQQYIPPVREQEPISIILPKQQNRRLSVLSLGYHFSMGNLDVTILLTNDDVAESHGPVPPPEEGDEGE